MARVKRAIRRCWPGHGNGRIGAVLLVGWLLVSCASQPVARDVVPPAPGGASAATRLELETMIDLTRAPRGGTRLLAWLAGKDANPPLVRRPYGVAWQGDDLLITDPDAGRLFRVLPSGKIRGSPEGVLESPIGVAVCAEGVVVTDSRAGRVLVLDEQLRVRRVLAEKLARPTGVACESERIFIAETGRHRVLVLEGVASPTALGERGIAPGQFNFPAALALDGSSLWVGDTLNFRLQRLDARAGVSLSEFGRLGDAPGDLPRVKGVAVDTRGRLWISDSHLDRVMLFSTEGELLTDLGGYGAAPGQFAFPAGIAAHPDGRVAVVDSLNRRVEVFRLGDVVAKQRRR